MRTQGIRFFVSTYLLGTVLGACPPLQGSFNVSIPNLYPENADWDPVHCKIYFGLYYNSSVAVYDPYRHEIDEVITFPGITGNNDYTITGVDYDGMGSMYFAATSYTAFLAISTGNPDLANFTGPDSIIRYDTNARKIRWITDLVPIQKEILKRTGKQVTGFQDMAEDDQGNSYAIGSFGTIILKVDRNGTPSVWYEPKNINDTLVSGGIVRSGNKLIIDDRLAPGLLTFDLNEPEGHPVLLSPKGFPANYSAGTDGLFLPSKYNNKVLLWSDDYYGTRVFGSTDNWKTAEYLGLAPMNSVQGKQGGFTTASLEIGQTIYSIVNFFHARPVSRREEWLIVDISKNVDDLVKVWMSKGRGY